MGGTTVNKRSTLKLATAFALSLFVGVSGFTTASHALDDLRIIAPAKPGGGWDQTARALEEVIRASGGAKSVTVENVAGAGGTVGLAQLVDKEKGNPNVLMVNGLVMVGAVLTNNSPATLDQVTPIARLTGEYEVIVVPAASQLKTLADLVGKLKADAGSVAFGGGSRRACGCRHFWL
jgi:putative tricarboxylic transport membrane protein